LAAYHERDGSTFAVVDLQQDNAQSYYFVVGTVATDPPSIMRTSSQAVAGEWEFKRRIDRDHVGLTDVTATSNCLEPECEGVLTRLAKGWTRELLPPKKSLPRGASGRGRCHWCGVYQDRWPKPHSPSTIWRLAFSLSLGP
jgi:hypothetical protein